MHIYDGRQFFLSVISLGPLKIGKIEVHPLTGSRWRTPVAGTRHKKWCGCWILTNFCISHWKYLQLDRFVPSKNLLQHPVHLKIEKLRLWVFLKLENLVSKWVPFSLWTLFSLLAFNFRFTVHFVPHQSPVIQIHSGRTSQLGFRCVSFQNMVQVQTHSRVASTHPVHCTGHSQWHPSPFA